MPRKFWWSTSMADQLVQVQNFRKKIAGYKAVLNLTDAQIAMALELCDTFAAAFNATEQCKQTMLAMTQWRDIVFYGEPEASPAPAAPIFPVIPESSMTRGTVNQFMALREMIVNLPGYTETIGEDLGIIGAEISPRPPSEVTPTLKAETSTGYWVNLSGSMQGMDALRVEYAPKGGQFATVAFLTNTPGGFQITPANPNQPESGHIRAVFIRRNEEIGNYSADYPVTLS